MEYYQPSAPRAHSGFSVKAPCIKAARGTLGDLHWLSFDCKQCYLASLRCSLICCSGSIWFSERFLLCRTMRSHLYSYVHFNFVCVRSRELCLRSFTRSLQKNGTASPISRGRQLIPTELCLSGFNVGCVLLWLVVADLWGRDNLPTRSCACRHQARLNNYSHTSSE